AVGRQHDVDPAPADREIRMVIEFLASRGEPIDELDRRTEVGELDRTLQRRGVPGPVRVQRREPGIDGLLIKNRCTHQPTVTTTAYGWIASANGRAAGVGRLRDDRTRSRP